MAQGTLRISIALVRHLIDCKKEVLICGVQELINEKNKADFSNTKKQPRTAPAELGFDRQHGLTLDFLSSII